MSEKSVAVILKENTILMEKLVIDGRAFYSLPGGTIEPGETPEQAVIRELKEECNLDVEVVRPLSVVHRVKNRTKYTFECKIVGDQIPSVGKDPEFPDDQQIIKDVLFMHLEDINEKDRAFLWSEGLMETGDFTDEVMSWGDIISYPKAKEDPSYSKLTGKCDDETVTFDADDILYIEKVDDKTFVYTSDRVIRVDYSLRDFEDGLHNPKFFRCSKSMIVNIDKVERLKSLSSNRIDVVLESNEHIIISRTYASDFRRLLKGGLKRD